MRVLLTGVTGYVGLVVASGLIAEGFHVRGLASRPNAMTRRLESTGNFEFCQGDLRDFQVLDQAAESMHSVVHLAAIVGEPAGARDPELTRRVNVEATKALFAAADRAGVTHLVFGSTCSVYGHHNQGVVTEATLPRPLSLYGWTKVEAEEHLLGQDRDVNVTVLRLATAYGVSPRMRKDLVVNQYVHQAALSGEITVMGPEVWRPHVHVRDIAQAVSRILSAPRRTRQQIYNLVTENLQHHKVATLVAADQLATVRISHRAAGADRRDYVVSGDKLTQGLGYEPDWTVAQGAAEVREHLLASIPRAALDRSDAARTHSSWPTLQGT